MTRPLGHNGRGVSVSMASACVRCEPEEDDWLLARPLGGASPSPTSHFLLPLEVPTGVINHFWIQVSVSLLKPPHGHF